MVYRIEKRLFFDRLSETWDDRFYNENIAKKLEHIVEEMNLPPESLILDVGTGTGNLLKPILTQINDKGRIIAIDYSEKMIYSAKKKFLEVGNLKFVVTDAHQMPFKNSIFDVVICFGVFPHFDDKKMATKEIWRILKNRGKLFIAHALSSKELREHHRRAPEVSKDFLPEKDEMERLLEGVGFRIEKLIDVSGKYLLEAQKN